MGEGYGYQLTGLFPGYGPAAARVQIVEQGGHPWSVEVVRKRLADVGVAGVQRKITVAANEEDIRAPVVDGDRVRARHADIRERVIA
jgi:hypothetical protein